MPPERLTRPVPPAIIQAILRYVEAAAGRDARDAVLRSLDPPYRAGDLLDPYRWATREEVADVAAAAAAVCSDDQIGRRAGEEEFQLATSMPFGHMLAATGSVEAACAQVAAHAARITLGRTLSVGEVGDGHLVVESEYLDTEAESRFACDFAAGYFSQIPTLFGYTGTAVETECRTRGGGRCSLRVAWRPDPSRHVSESARSERTQHSRDLVDWFEESHATAARLVGAADVDELLVEVVQQARNALQAPQFLLTARLRGDHDARIHHAGFDEAAAAHFAEQLADGSLPADDRIVVADIAAGGRTYGRLAAVFPTAEGVSALERRMLTAYAEHVATALHAIASLERARHDRDTARALLGLARAFSEVTTVQDVASRLTLAMPEAIGCELATVWLSEPAVRRLRVIACRDGAGNERPFEPREVPVDEVEDLRDAMWSRHPTIVGIADLPAKLHPALTSLGVCEVAVVPIAAKGELLGVVAAGFATPIGVQERNVLVERLSGLTAHASTALQNADLLERMRHQALHDTLTGLPNRSLAEDRGNQALAAIERSNHRVALLFLDLDGFKEVNDRHGHLVGDALIRHVGARLDGLMRASDTVARMGGDEFVVLMPAIETEKDAIEVAERILEALRRPVHVDGHDFPVSCSIGMASSDVACDYDDLLRRADAAMYRAKAAGGAVYAIDDGATALPDPLFEVDATVEP